MVSAPEHPTQLAPAGQCYRACDSGAHLGALPLAHAHTWNLLCHCRVNDLLNEWPQMVNWFHLTFRIRKNQELQAFLLTCRP